MKYTAIVPVVLLAALILAAGCTGTGGQATPAPTAVPQTPLQTMEVPATASSATGAGGSTVPGVTQTIPANEAVTVTVEKAGIYSTTIISSFDGGKGINFVSRVEVKVTRPDGSVVTGTLKPMMGETLELEGTKGTDRVEVTAFMKSGKVYKIIDRQMPYKTRG
jgi:hypothetical protein